MHRPSLEYAPFDSDGPPTVHPAGRMQTASVLVSQPATPATRVAARVGASSWVDAVLGAALAGVALAVRWPYLWTIPRFTDETLEVLHSLAIVRDGTRPLTNYDSYYGALYNYLVAAGLWLGGESPFAPRAVVLAAGALTVAATYALGRELAIQLLGSATCRGVAPRLSGSLAALMLATNGQHVVVNSHIAWSNCLTPLATALALWALLQATRRRDAGAVDDSPTDGREPLHVHDTIRMTGESPATPQSVRDVPPGASSVLRPNPRRDRWAGAALALAGLALGAALQTHPLVATLLPGVVLGVFWRRFTLLRTPWPYLAAVLFLVGYANVLAFNVGTGFESLRSAQRMSAEYAQDQQATVGYLPTAGSMALMLARTLGGAVDQRAAPADYLADPLVLAVGALAGTGLVWLAWRGQPLPLLVVASMLLLLPAVNSKFRTLLTSRYLMPLAPLLFACAAAALVGLVIRARTALATTGRAHLVLPLAGALVLGLVLGPLLPLARYYDRALARSDTNERILRLTAEIQAARQPGELVLVDEAIGAELPDTGVTELRGFEHLLIFERVPYRTVRPTPGRLQDELPAGGSALVVLNARDASAAAGRLTLAPLDPRPPSETGRMSDYRLYRLSRARA